MNPATRSIYNRNQSAVFASLLLVSFYLLQIKYLWPGLKISGILGPVKYMDQDAVLKSATCFERIGNEVYRTDVIPRECGNFVYSVELLRFLNFFKFPDLGGYTLGTSFLWLTVIVLCSIFFLTKNLKKLDKAIGFAAFMTPGIWLLLERGNYDEVIFILAFVASLFLATKYQEVGLVLLLLASLMKFYTLPIFVVSIFFLKRKFSKIAFGLASVLVTFYSLNLINQIETFPSTWFISFGLDSLGLYANLFLQEVISADLQLPRMVISGIGLIFLVISYFYLSKYKHFAKFKFNIDPPKKSIQELYLTMLGIFLSCFFAGMNYDYRLIYLAVLISLAPVIFAPSGFKNIVTISGFCALALSTFSFGFSRIPGMLIQLIGDVSLYVYVTTQIFYLKGLLISRLKG